MIKIDPHQTFEATARINLPALQASFGIKCRLIGMDELSELQKRWLGEPAVPAVPAREATQTQPAQPAKPGKPAVKPTLTNGEFINGFLVGFGDDVVGADDRPLPFTPENVKRLLNQPGAVDAVITAFLSGYAEEEAKNSVPPSAG